MPAELDRAELRRLLRSTASSSDVTSLRNLARQLLAQRKPADTMFCASVFAEAADALIAQERLKRLKTYVVRSVTVEPILPSLSVASALAGYVLDLRVGGYGSYVDEMMNPGSELALFAPDLVLVILDLEEIAGQLPDLCASGRAEGVEEAVEESAARFVAMLRSFRTGNRARMLVQGCVVPGRTSLGEVGEANLKFGLQNAVKRLNGKLAELCSTIPDCVFFDVDGVAADYGRANWRDERLFLASRLPLSAAAFEVYARGLVRSFSTLFRAPRKVLCTDLDNTLWGGVLGEEGPEGIATGSAFPGNCYLEYQKHLKRLSARGILLAAVSKNNIADVEEAFRIRAADLALQLGDFAATKIGWNEKADALRELAAELSLGLDSFVFVDDNPVECAAIRQELPEVAVIAAPADEPWKLVELLADGTFFDSATVTDDDLNRSGEYRAQAQRNALSTQTSSREEFLESLGIVCTFVSVLEAPLARSVQLLAKTNQFNLTTRRHSATEVEEFANGPGGLAVAVRVRDRFGDAGVVGLALAQVDGQSCTVDSLLLSCRVIGRGIESALLAFVAAQAVVMGARKLVGEYVESRKNAPAKSFYPDHGFVRDSAREQSGSGSEFYALDLTETVPVSPAWLTLEGNESYEFAARTLLAS